MKRGCLISIAVLGALLGGFVYIMWPTYWANSHSVYQLNAISQLRDLDRECLDYEARTGSAPSGWDAFDPDWATRIQNRYLEQSDADEMVVHWDAFANRHADPHAVFVEFPGVTMRYVKRTHDNAWLRGMEQLACGQVNIESTRGGKREVYDRWFDECRLPYRRLELELRRDGDDSLVARCTLDMPALLPAPWTLEVLDTSPPLTSSEGIAHWRLTGPEEERTRIVRLNPDVVDHNMVFRIRDDSGTWQYVTDAGVEASGRLLVVDRSGGRGSR